MKNLRNSLLLLFALFAFGQTAWAQFSGGTGTANDPYQISTEADWSTLCSNVNNNTSTYSGKFFKMTADITVAENFSSAPTKMVGRGENVNFRGTFDGNGHTLTVNYSDNHNERACAPFRYIRNATIKNLHVAGSITKQYNKNAGGLVGVAFGTCHIINCRSSVEITCHESDCSSGGFIGKLGTSSDSDDTYIDNCLFDGKLEGPSSHAWGGFIGWVEDEPDAYISNCLFNPEHVYINSEGTKTFARGSDIHITNCYHTYPLVDTQGSTKAKDMDKEILRMKLGETWEHIGDKVQPALKSHPLTVGNGTEQSPYLIASVEDWNKLATNVYLGESYNDAYFQMTENISVSRVVGYHPGGDTYNAFRGTFDGGGHTLTFNYTTDAEFCAPFAYTYGATIKNLITTGTITTSKQHAGGVVGRNGTNRLTLENVKSDVTINSTYSGSAEHGGLVGYAINADLIGCAFTGSFLGENSTGCCGLIGWKTGTTGSSANLTNCLFAPANITVGNNNAYTFVRIPTEGEVNITNCYYTQSFGTEQGKQALSIVGAENVTVAFAGTATEYNASGLSTNGIGLAYLSTLYAGQDDNVSLNLTASDGYVIGTGAATYTPEGGTATEIVPVEGVYSFTMPDANVVINAPLIAGYTLDVTGYGDSDGGWVFIASPVLGSIAPDAVGNLLGGYVEATGKYDYDLYRFNQSPAFIENAYKEWENYHKHNTTENPFMLVNGQGYLYATKETKTLVFTGTFNEATEQEVSLVYETTNPSNKMHGYNLVGNPFPRAAYITDRSYYKMSEDGSYISATPASASDYIPPCTGVIVQATGEGQSVTFSTTAPEPQGANYNNGSLQIALVQANTRSNAVMDNAIVSFNEGSQLGKFYFGTQNANIYLPQGQEEYAIAYSDKQGEMPLNFKANENGTYTITVNPENVEVGYLHLFDNMTGADVDLMQNPSYSFNAKVTDYESRFKLMFAADEAVCGPSEVFAFISNGNLIVNGTGTLQVIDLLGRQLSSQEIHSAFYILHSAFPSGVYVLRLINGNDVKTQKIVIE